MERSGAIERIGNAHRAIRGVTASAIFDLDAVDDFPHGQNTPPNDLKPPFTLRPGQKLKIPGGRYHVVKKGQSCIAIARAYQVEWTRIIELNHLKEPFTLREGQRLMLPPAKEVAKMSLEQRAAAFKIDLTDLATGSEPALA